MEKPRNREELVAVTLLANVALADIGVVVVVEELVPGSIVGAGLAVVEFASPGRAVEPLIAPESVVADKEASVKARQAGGDVLSNFEMPPCWELMCWLG
jgi:hypothetical protein